MVTDPPAGISFMNQEWDHHKGGSARWISWMTGVMQEAYRVLKPGSHGLVWALPRTSHWTATALEMAGFEIRDVITHHFGSGFPKNMDVAKQIDKTLGFQPTVTGNALQNGAKFKQTQQLMDNGGLNDPDRQTYPLTEPSSKEGQQWHGWGTALKPATENWILIRKPFKGTVAQNVLQHGTGALNIGDSRIDSGGGNLLRPRGLSSIFGRSTCTTPNALNGGMNGRWPSNLILTHSQACGAYCVEDCPVSLIGSESRFFYCAKPSKGEKEEGLEGIEGDLQIHLRKFEAQKVNDGRKTEIDNAYQRGETLRKNTHPTVKSIDLMTYLIRLITPAGAHVLDPFMGSGSTGVAAIKGHWQFTGIEQHPPYFLIATERIHFAEHNLQLCLPITEK